MQKKKIQGLASVFGRLEEDSQFADPNFQDRLAPQLPHNCVLVARCDVGELYVLTFYELLTQTASIPNQRTPHYRLLLYRASLVDF
jgi:hypothetical protein